MIILSYQGPEFTDVRSVTLAEGLSVDDYLESLPEGQCGIRVKEPDDLKRLGWAVISRLFNILNGGKGRFLTEDDARSGLYSLVCKRAVKLDTLPKKAKDFPKPLERQKFSSASPASDGVSNGPLTPKKKHVPVQDKWSEMTTDALAKEAVRRGYHEQPFPNGGVRKMRLLNFLRGKGK